MQTDTSTDTWQFFLSPPQAWEAMLAACAGAKRSIEFEQYIIEDDHIGKRFLRLFADKAKEGVSVFLLCDTFGSAGIGQSPLVKELREYGGIFDFYNPIGWHNIVLPWTWFPRTHTKTLLIDSASAFTGGVCLAERMKGWRDTHVHFSGEAVEDVRQAFDALRAARRHRQKHIVRPPLKRRAFFYLQNIPRLFRHAIYYELLRAINGATSTICISTAYFVPNRRFLAALRHAHRRGVKIRLLVPERSDVHLADLAALTYVPHLLRSGVRVFHYRKTVLHTKTAVVDRDWATVGSTNMDILSFFHNREANLIITQPEAVAQLQQHFDTDLQDSMEITWETWNHIPVWKKFTGRMARSLKVFFRLWRRKRY